jgi:hypothetical protein
MTDTEISRQRDMKERELIPWKPTEGAQSGLEDLESLSRAPRNWDQFAVNKEKFGVTTTWDERHYTTDLDRSSEFYRSNLAKASKIAAEIEKGASNGNVHIMEERGHDTSAYTEEELYSSVMRDEKPKYVPPHQRNIPQKQDKQLTPPTTTSPKVAPTITTTPSTTDKKPALQITTKASALQQINSELEQAATKSTTQTTEDVPLKRPQLQLESVASRTMRANSLSAKLTPTGSPTSVLDQKEILKERIRLRQQIVNHSTGSPIGLGSPVASPLINSPVSPSVMKDPALALSLDPAIPKVSDEIRDEFLKFKLNESFKTRNDQIDQFKLFSRSLDTKKKPDTPTTTTPTTPTTTTPTTTPMTVTNPTASSGGSLVLSMAKRNKAKDTAPKVTPHQEEKKEPKEPSVINTEKHPPHTPTPATPGTPAPGVSHTVAAKGTEKAPTTAEKPKPSLNPNAKEFKFNPNAKSFMPPSRKPTPKPPSPSQSPPPPHVFSSGPFVPYGGPPMNMYPPPMPYGGPMYMPPHMGMPGPMPVMHHPHMAFTLPQNVDTNITVAETFVKGIANQKQVDAKTVGFTWPSGRQNSYKDPPSPKSNEQEMPPMQVSNFS